MPPITMKKIDTMRLLRKGERVSVKSRTSGNFDGVMVSAHWEGRGQAARMSITIGDGHKTHTFKSAWDGTEAKITGLLASGDKVTISPMATSAAKTPSQLATLAPWLVPGATVLITRRNGETALRRVIEVDKGAKLRLLTREGTETEANPYAGWASVPGGIADEGLTVVPYTDAGERWFAPWSHKDISVDVAKLVKIIVDHYVAKGRARGLSHTELRDDAGKRASAMATAILPAIRARIAAKIRNAYPEIDESDGLAKPMKIGLPGRTQVDMNRSSGIWAVAAPDHPTTPRPRVAGAADVTMPLTSSTLAAAVLAEAIAGPMFKWPTDNHAWANTVNSAVVDAVFSARRAVMMPLEAQWSLARKQGSAAEHAHRILRTHTVAGAGARGVDLNLAIIREFGPLALTSVDHWNGIDLPELSHLPTGAKVWGALKHATSIDATDSEADARVRTATFTAAFERELSALLSQLTQAQIVTIAEATSPTREAVDAMRPIHDGLNAWWEPLRRRWHEGLPDKPLRGLAAKSAPAKDARSDARAAWDEWDGAEVARELAPTAQASQDWRKMAVPLGLTWGDGDETSTIEGEAKPGVLLVRESSNPRTLYHMQRSDLEKGVEIAEKNAAFRSKQNAESAVRNHAEQEKQREADWLYGYEPPGGKLAAGKAKKILSTLANIDGKVGSRARVIVQEIRKGAIPVRKSWRPYTSSSRPEAKLRENAPGLQRFDGVTHLDPLMNETTYAFAEYVFKRLLDRLPVPNFTPSVAPAVSGESKWIAPHFREI